MTRERLPNRRGSLMFEFVHDNIPFQVSVSFFTDGRLGEIFVDAGKVGSAVDILARECAIAASLALQHGCPAAELRNALLHQKESAAAGPLGALFEIIERVPA